MENQKKTLDYLIFNRGIKPTEPIKATPQEIKEHLQGRLQLDFYLPKLDYYTIDDNLSISSHYWPMSRDVIEQMAHPQQNYSFHLTIEGMDKFRFPVLNADSQKDKIKPQEVNLIATKAHHSLEPFDSAARFENLPTVMAELTQLPALAKLLKQIYQQPVLKFNLILDAGLYTQSLTGKDLSYLRTFFRQNFDENQDQLLLTNSNSQIGADVKALLPMKKTIPANQIAQELVSNKPLKKNTPFIDLTTITTYFKPINQKPDKHTIYFFNANQKEFSDPKVAIKNVEKTSKTNVKANKNNIKKSSAKTETTKPIDKPKVKANSQSQPNYKEVIKNPFANIEAEQARQAKPKIKAKPSIPNVYSIKRQSASDIDTNDFNTNISVSDMLARHTKKSNVFDNRVKIERAGKPVPTKNDENKNDKN